MRTPLLILSCLVWCGCSRIQTRPGPTPTPVPGGLQVRLETVKPERLQGELRLPGRIRATEDKSVSLTAPLDGVVVSVLARVGQRVQAGDPLLRLNNVYGVTAAEALQRLETAQKAVVDSRAQLAESLGQLSQARNALGQTQISLSEETSERSQALTELELARIYLRRKRELVEAGISPQVELDEARARLSKAEAAARAADQELKVARSQVSLAERNVKQLGEAVEVVRQSVELAESGFERTRAIYTQANLVGSALPPGMSRLSVAPSQWAGAAEAAGFVVRAPIAGTLNKLSVSQGQRLSAGAELGEVIDLSQVYVDADAFEEDARRIELGTPFQLTSSGRDFQGKVSEVGRRVDPQTRTIRVRGRLDNPRGDLRPDTFVEVGIELPVQAEALTVARSAVLSDGEQSYVLAEESPGSYQRRHVLLGMRQGERIQVLRGLRAGDKVVTQGGLLLEARER